MQIEKDIWIFLSHSRADFEKVRLIRNYLEEKKCRPLMFYLKCLNSEEETFELIKREIDVRTRFIVCDSDNARASKWVRKEIEYITAREPKRSYLRLDLAKPISEVETDIDRYVLNTYIFLSYPRSMLTIARQVYTRLSKYDLRVLFDMEDITDGDSGRQLQRAMQMAAQSGYFLLFSDGRPSEFLMEEMAVARTANATIIAVATSSMVKDFYLTVLRLSREQIISTDDCNARELSDKIVDAVLKRIYPLGSLLTFADNFRSEMDHEEAVKCDKMFVEEAEKSASPGVMGYLADCYRDGLHGLPIDLRMEREWLSIAIHEGQRMDLIPRAKEVNMRLQRMDHERAHPSFFTKARNLLKKWRTRHGQH